MRRLWRSLAFKWFFTLLFTGLFGVGLVWFFANKTTSSGFDQLKIDQAQAIFVATVQQYYEAHGTWDGIADTMHPKENHGNGNQFETSNGTADNGPKQMPPQFLLTDNSYKVVIPAPPFHIGEQLTEDQCAKGTTITVNGQKVGTVLFTQGNPSLDPFEQHYLARTNQGLILGAGGAATIALLVGFMLTRHFMRPLRDLTHALGAMRQGKLGQQLPVRSRDELGELTESFNQMSQDLAQANYLRRQMTADIAHDLRTPLTVISGYLEGLQDGTLKPTPQRFETMNNEVVRLKRLVEDLRTLSLADAGELRLTYQTGSIDSLLNHVAASFQPLFAEKDLHLEVQIEPGLPYLNIDRERIGQVLGNLVSNALRHTPPGGKVVLRAWQRQEGVQLAVSDTGEGIPLDKLPYVFERFYRVDESRSEGESGLGLAIVKSIAEAHGSTVDAQSEVGKGTTISINFPKQLIRSPEKVA